MLENISWSTYWVWVTVILLTYYTFIIIYFYGFQIRKVFLKISMSPGSQAQNDADLFATVHVLINDIENSFGSLHRQSSKVKSGAKGEIKKDAKQKKAKD